jgi:hypothetical protein
MPQAVRLCRKETNMDDEILTYRACGAECREDWLRMLACDNGLPLADVLGVAERFGEAEDFGRLVEFCEGAGEVRS